MFAPTVDKAKIMLEIKSLKYFRLCQVSLTWSSIVEPYWTKRKKLIENKNTSFSKNKKDVFYCNINKQA